jgi:hypothetical protein
MAAHGLAAEHPAAAFFELLSREATPFVIVRRGWVRDHLGGALRSVADRQHRRANYGNWGTTRSGVGQRVLARVRSDDATGRFSQVSGLRLDFACNGVTPVVTGLWKAPNWPSGPLAVIGPNDTVTLVINDVSCSHLPLRPGIPGRPGTLCSTTWRLTSEPTRRSRPWSRTAS